MHGAVASAGSTAAFVLADTTTTTTAASVETSTTSTLPPGGCVNPVLSCQHHDVVFHIMGNDGATARAVQRGRGHLAEVLTEVCWCLGRNGALDPGFTLTCCNRVFFDSRGRPNVFICARNPGTARFLWVFAPQHLDSPTTIAWNPQLEFPDVLDLFEHGASQAVILSTNGVLRTNHPNAVAPGHVVMAASHAHLHSTLPLNVLRDRCIGVQSLLFCSRGPSSDCLSDRGLFRTWCYRLVHSAQKALGEDRRGNLCLIAGMHAPPLFCCPGTPLPPSQSQLQAFYNRFLSQHFGQMSLRDTGHVHYDACYFVQRQDSVERRIWVLPLASGADSLYGDIQGRCLIERPAPHGLLVEPSLCSGWLGLSRLQPAEHAGMMAAQECIRIPPGLSSDSEENDGSRNSSRPLTAAEQRILQRWEQRNRHANIVGASSGNAQVDVSSDTSASSPMMEISSGCSASSCSALDALLGDDVDEAFDPDARSSHNLLQLRAEVHHEVRANCSIASVPSTAHVQKVLLWTAAGPVAFSFPSSASYEQVSLLGSKAAGFEIIASHIMPVTPDPVRQDRLTCILAKDPWRYTSILVEFEGGRQPLVVHLEGRAAAADVCDCVGARPASVTFADCPWRGDVDGLFHGMCLRVGGTAIMRSPMHAFPLALEYQLHPRTVMGAQAAADLKAAVGGGSRATWALTLNNQPALPFLAPAYAKVDTSQNALSRNQGPMTYHLFTDGSAIQAGPSQRMGSAFSVWIGRDDFDVLVGSFSCSLGCLPDHGNDGAFMAECCALKHAVAWIMSSSSHTPYVVHFDSLRAGRAAEGMWKISGASAAAVKLCEALRALVLIASETHQISFVHVKAHTGCFPNELVDAWAKAAAHGRTNTPIPEAAAGLFVHENLQWAWLSLSHDPSLPALEGVLGQKVFASEPSEASDLAKGVMFTGAPCAGPEAHATTHCRTVSYNVQSALDGKGLSPKERSLGGARLRLMLETFAKRQWHFVGLQETRLQGSAVRLTNHFICVQSSAVRGQLGVALWIARSWKGVQGQSIMPSHLTVLCTDPRLLIVRCCSPACRADFCVAHAPQRGQGAEACAQWWEETTRKLASLSRDSHPLVMMIDANASIGGTESEHVGGHHGDAEDMSGFSFHTLLASRRLWLPSTFAECHEGDTATFFNSHTGPGHRLDFVAISMQRAISCVESSWVDADLDLAQKRIDHRPAILDVMVCLHGNSRRPSTVNRAWSTGDRSMLVQMGSTRTAAVWDTSVDAHADLLANLLQEKVFPKKHLAPRKPFVTEESWLLIQARNRSRRRLANSDGLVRREALRQFFVGWKGVRGPPVVCDFRTLARLRLTRAKWVVEFQRLGTKLREALASDKVAHLRRISSRCAESFQEGDLREAYRCLQVFRQKSKNVKSQARALPALAQEDGSLVRCSQERADRWLEFFAGVESAETIPRELITTLALETPGAAHRELVDSAGGCIPTLLQWERSIRSVKPGKQPGPDGIRTELCRLHVPTIAKTSFSLFLKSALLCQEPLRFKGGLLAALYKGRGEHMRCENSRSILLSNTLGKCWHSCLRRQTLPFVERQIRPEQAGAVPRKTLDTAAMAIRAPSMLAQAQKRAAAVVFLDVKSAFYSVFRPLLLGSDQSDDFLAYSLKALKIPPIFTEWLRDIADDRPLASKAGCPDFLVKQLAQTLQHSWFATSGSHELGYSMGGTRPGDPLGDLLFVLLCADVLWSLHAALISQELHTPGLAQHLDPCLVTPAWMDDVALFQWSPCAEQLMRRVRALCTLAHNEFGKKGLILNTSKGKSACMPMLRGHQSRTVRLMQEADWNTGLAYASMSGTHSMPFTKAYKHLGGVMDFTLALSPEIRARIMATRLEVNALRRPVFSCSLVPLRVRIILLRSLVISKALHLAGTWRELGVLEAKAWRQGVLHAYMALFTSRQEAEKIGRSMHAVCGHFCLPHPDALLSYVHAVGRGP